MIGTTVGSYRITQKVSVGGMGTVYKAEHALIGKLAAVKVLHQELRNNRDVVNRFFNEAKATTQIKHPGIVEIFDFGYLPSGDGYIVMEFLEGVSLARRMRKGKMAEGKAAVLLKGVCSALGAAHAKHIVHRDLKPDNIFLCPDPDQPTGERPKLLDFGIAKLSDANLAGSGSATKTGAVMGTPTYMSPEQCKGAGLIDHRADLYALGCIFYELVCGVPPFVAEGAGELIGMHLYVEPEPPTTHEPSVSAAAETLIMALLDKDPANRPQTARELGQRFALLAQSAGWLSTTGPTAMAAVPEVDDPEDEPAAISSVVASSADATPAFASPSAPEPRVHVTSKPTTLSGAASQSVIDVPRSRKVLWLGAIGLAAAAVVTVAIVMSTGSGDRKAATAGSAAATMPSTGTTGTPGPDTAHEAAGHATDTGRGTDTGRPADDTGRPADTKHPTDTEHVAVPSGSGTSIGTGHADTGHADTGHAKPDIGRPNPGHSTTGHAKTVKSDPRTTATGTKPDGTKPDTTIKPSGTTNGSGSGSKILIENDI